MHDALSPTCDLCDAQDDVQDEKHHHDAVFSKRFHPQVCSLRLKYTSLFSGRLLPLSHPSLLRWLFTCLPSTMYSLLMTSL
eukprot:224845-Pelagomonas_calceolata.AAC.1